MQVTVRSEAGYEWALYGISLSYKDRAIPFEEWWTQERKDKAKERSIKLAPMDGGHNKFLESIVVHIDIEAPRYWWQEFDTYRAGVTKQSEGTMHTLYRRLLTSKDFDTKPPKEVLIAVNKAITTYQQKPTEEAFVAMKDLLPEGYLQRRLVTLNYKNLRNMILQRKNHKLPHWHTFVDEVIRQVEHPELLPKADEPNQGNIFVLYKDDGPKGIHTQDLATTMPWERVFRMETQEELETLKNKVKNTKSRKNPRITATWADNKEMAEYLGVPLVEEL